MKYEYRVREYDAVLDSDYDPRDDIVPSDPECIHCRGTGIVDMGWGFLQCTCTEPEHNYAIER